MLSDNAAVSLSSAASIQVARRDSANFIELERVRKGSFSFG
jgi:hypothetical protein